MSGQQVNQYLNQLEFDPHHLSENELDNIAGENSIWCLAFAAWTKTSTECLRMSGQYLCPCEERFCQIVSEKTNISQKQSLK